MLLSAEDIQRLSGETVDSSECIAILSRRAFDAAFSKYIEWHTPEPVSYTHLPRSGAEEISGRLVALGIQGFWNFSHYDLSVPYPDVVVENVHLGDSLMSLGYRLRNQD